MSILVNNDTKLLIQGITGKEGQRSYQWVSQYGTAVLAGVTPGKGGQDVDGVPVYNSVPEALRAHSDINASSIYAPPQAVLPAAIEALQAGIKLLHIIAEDVPTKDTVEILNLARQRKAHVVGPSSIGLISPGQGKIGSIGGTSNQQFKEGSVAVISKSGGMSSEISLLLSKNGFGQSTVVGIGGNKIIGTTFADLVSALEADPQTKAIVVIGEIGGAYEEMLAQKLREIPSHKPYVAFISGLFASQLPSGMSFGHAGAIVDSQIGTREGKIRALKEVSVQIANNPSDIVELLQQKISKDW